MKISTGELEAHTLAERRVMLKTEAQAQEQTTQWPTEKSQKDKQRSRDIHIKLKIV
jgi:hypothetical protein